MKKIFTFLAVLTSLISIGFSCEGPYITAADIFRQRYRLDWVNRYYDPDIPLRLTGETKEHYSMPDIEREFLTHIHSQPSTNTNYVIEFGCSRVTFV